MMHHAKIRAGFTFIELLGALALAIVLTTAVSGLIGVLAQKREALLARLPAQPWQAQAERQVRWDLANSRQFRQTPTALVLEGYGARDIETRQNIVRPCRIHYQIQTIDGRSWLVRREEPMDPLTNEQPHTELVCHGADRIEMELPDERERRPDHSGQIPAGFSLKLFCSGSTTPAVDLRYLR